MTDSVFIDSNIHLYAVDHSDPEKMALALQCLEQLSASAQVVISTQVLLEFYNIATKKLIPPMDRHEAKQAVEDMHAYDIISVTPAIVSAAITRTATASVSIWDAVIIEAALQAGCARLISEDMQHGQVFDEQLTIENPFLAS